MRLIAIKYLNLLKVLLKTPLISGILPKRYGGNSTQSNMEEDVFTLQGCVILKRHHVDAVVQTELRGITET